MKKSCALALAGLGSISLAAAAPSSAAGAPAAPTAQHASQAPVVGNLQHTPMQYWCNKGVPSYILAVRAVKAPEKSVTFTEVELKETHTLGPVTHDKPLMIFSKANLAGKHVTLQVTGNTSGSAFTVTGTVPMTCVGLPKVQPNGSVTPAPGQTKPAPVTNPTSPTPGKPAPAEPTGPQVQTDLVASQGAGASGELALAALALAALAGGGVVAARRRS